MNPDLLVTAFASGMLATVNPCGFAMLPAYLSYFLGLDDPSADAEGSVWRALVVSATVTGGFVVVFGVIGIAIQVFSLPVEQHVATITMVLGVGIVALGIAMLAGYQPTFGLPKLERGGKERTLGSMFVFGMSYAVASLSCTLPIFIVNVINSFRADSTGAGLVTFLTYALGMGLLLTAITVGLALARASVVQRLRGLLPYVGRIAGVLLVAAGAYLVYWGWFERQVLSGNTGAGGPAGQMLDWNSRLSNWINSFGAARLGLLLALFIVGALVTTAWRSRRHADRVHTSDR